MSGSSRIGRVIANAVSEGLRRVDAVGGTAMYDAAIQAVRKAQDGRNRKKAVVLISDGNDTSSSRGLRDVRRVVRESEVLVYAIGIDGSGEPTIRTRPPTFPPTPIPFPFPIPDRGRPGTRWPGLPQLPPTIGRTAARDRLNAQALRDITDDSGGRTEVVRSPRDLSPATASIADELSKQVLARLHEPGESRRPLALNPRGSARPIRASPSAARLYRVVIPGPAGYSSVPGSTTSATEQ